MSSAIRGIPKRRGRPKTTGKGTPVMVRLQRAQLTAVDAWIVRQGEPPPSRPEALRRLAEMGLISDKSSRPMPKKAAGKAQAIAEKALDGLKDKFAPPGEQQRRKERLLKGPPEFRDLTRGKRRRS